MKTYAVISRKPMQTSDQSAHNPMHKSHHQSSEICSVPEQQQRHERVFSQLLLVKEEDEDRSSAKDEQADDFGRIPRERFSTKVEAEQKHGRDSKN